MKTENASNVRSCFSCSATFENDKDFLQHIFEVDCTTYETKPDEKESGSREKMEVTPSNNAFILSCGLCNIQFSSADDQATHNRSNEHRARVTVAAERYSTNANFKPTNSARVYSLFCNECQVPLPSHAARELHVIGKKHLKRLAQLARDEAEESDKKSSSSPDSATPPSFDPLSTNPNEPASMPNINDVDPFLQLLSGGDCSNSMINLGNESHEQIRNVVSTTSMLPTDNYTQLNNLLRRLCLTQILHLIHGLDKNAPFDSSTLENSPTVSSFSRCEKTLTEDVLLEMMRGVCREELQNILPPRFFT